MAQHMVSARNETRPSRPEAAVVGLPEPVARTAGPALAVPTASPVPGLGDLPLHRRVSPVGRL